VHKARRFVCWEAEEDLHVNFVWQIQCRQHGWWRWGGLQMGKILNYFVIVCVHLCVCGGEGCGWGWGGGVRISLFTLLSFWHFKFCLLLHDTPLSCAGWRVDR
jgi:hypothetical protein